MLFRNSILSGTVVLAAFLTLVNSISLPPSDTLHTRARREPRLSNAERFKRGLPPNSPRQVYDPTHAARALAPRTSNVVTTAYVAEIAYVDAPSAVVGYLALTPGSSGHLAWVSTSSSADTYYAPANVPADSVQLYTSPTAYSGNFYIQSVAAGTAGVNTFTGTTVSTATGTQVFDFSDFDSSHHIALTYVSTGSTPINIYASPTSPYMIYAGPSAATINSVYSTSLSETDEIYVTLAQLV